MVCSRLASLDAVVCWWLLFVAGAGAAHAQSLLANDDSYGVPFGATLVVETFGVLDNDILDDEAAGESGATADLVSDAVHGTLALSSDGAFTYSPGVTFEGNDQFVYRAVYATASAEATVELTACTGGPQVFECWKEAAFLEKAAELGYAVLREGFEHDATWGLARSPTTAPSVSSHGIEWRANDFDPTHIDPPLAPPPPAPNEITTGPGPARTGDWALFDLEHGYAWGTPSQCDVDDPEPHCLYHDGFTLIPQPGSASLHGAGGFFTGTYGANVAIVLDGDYLDPIGGGQLTGGPHQFFGVIDAGPVGLTQLQFRELDGKVGQALFIFGDDFSVLPEPGERVLQLTALAGLALLRRGRRR
jgi:hypothetical protein